MAMSVGVMGPVSIDQTADLWLKIDQFHLNYLKSDETTKKIDIRKKLEGFIHQYMCLVPQDRKFCNAMTGEIILQSCRWVPDFSALSAARAFESIEKYAANLINQPWRKEFREIKQFGGFYKHQVQKYLSGGERLFHQMGYMSTVHESLVLDGPIDQDRITTVARDCILAFVECQIIASIVQGVSAHFPCTWEEALIFRRDHIGTPEQAVRSLVYLKNQMRYQQGVQTSPVVQGAPYYPRFPSPQGLSGQMPPNAMVQHPGQMLPYGYQPQMGYYPNPGMHPNQIPGYTVNGVTNGHSVPTGKLIDVEQVGRNGDDANRGGSSGSSSSTVTGRQGPIPLTIKHLEEENKRKSMLVQPEITNGKTGNGNNSLETWDYVYRQLENIGYTKDQAERPDVLEILSHMARKRQVELQQQQQYQQQHQQQQHHQQQQQQKYQQQQQRSQQSTQNWSDDHRQASPEVVEHRKASPEIGLTSEDESSRQYNQSNSHLAPRPNPRHRRHEEAEEELPAEYIQSQQRSATLNHATSNSRNRETSQTRNGTGRRRYSEEEAHVSQTVVVQQQQRPARHTKPLQPPAASPQQPPKLPQKKRHMPQVPQQTSTRHWDCHACTYRNRSTDEICAMCAKSRQYGSSVGFDSESGGCTTDDYETTNGDEDLDEKSFHEPDKGMIVCSKCTLKNPISLKTCDACGASLHISPIKSSDDDEYTPPPPSRG